MFTLIFPEKSAFRGRNTVKGVVFAIGSANEMCMGGPPLPHPEDRPDVALAAEGGLCGARAGCAGEVHRLFSLCFFFAMRFVFFAARFLLRVFCYAFFVAPFCFFAAHFSPDALKS